MCKKVFVCKPTIWCFENKLFWIEQPVPIAGTWQWQCDNYMSKIMWQSIESFKFESTYLSISLYQSTTGKRCRWRQTWSHSSHSLSFSLISVSHILLEVCVRMRSYAFVCVVMRSYAFVCICISFYAFVCIRMRWNAFVCVCMSSYAFICVNMHAYALYAFVCVRMRTFALVCVRMRSYAHFLAFYLPLPLFLSYEL